MTRPIAKAVVRRAVPVAPVVVNVTVTTAAPAAPARSEPRTQPAPQQPWGKLADGVAQLFGAASKYLAKASAPAQQPAKLPTARVLPQREQAMLPGEAPEFDQELLIEDLQPEFDADIPEFLPESFEQPAQAWAGLDFVLADLDSTQMLE